MTEIPTPRDAFPSKKLPKKKPYRVKPHLTHRPFRQGLSRYHSKKEQKET